MDIDEKYKEFIVDLLVLASENDISDILGWTEDLEFYIDCSDVFAWGTTDAEPVTPDTFYKLKTALEDAESLDGALLYCARQRKMRPQGAFYNILGKPYWPLFDECGAKRQIDLANPKEIE